MLSDAIDGDGAAYDWLNNQDLYLYMIIASACQGSEKAKNYLAKNNLDYFIRFADTVANELEWQRRNQTDYHKFGS